jgi:hypothetical protein
MWGTQEPLWPVSKSVPEANARVKYLSKPKKNFQQDNVRYVLIYNYTLHLCVVIISIIDTSYEFIYAIQLTLLITLTSQPYTGILTITVSSFEKCNLRIVHFITRYVQPFLLVSNKFVNFVTNPRN